MVGLIKSIWHRWWRPARVNDAQLMRLCSLQAHDLIELAAITPKAVSYSKGQRLWRLVDALPFAIRLRR